MEPYVGERQRQKHEISQSEKETNSFSEIQEERKELRQIEQEISEVRRERVRQAECIGRLHYQNETEAAKTHEKKMQELDNRLEDLRKEAEFIEEQLKGNRRTESARDRKSNSEEEN